MMSNADAGSLKKVIRSIILAAFLVSAAGCQLSLSLMEEVDAKKITKSGSRFTLEWSDGTVSDNTYTVYCRDHGKTQWTTLATGIETRMMEVTGSLLPYGDYEFGVSSVSADGLESQIHTSLDSDADPSSGWYLEWIP